MVKKPLMIAEFTTNHMGNLNILLRMVEKAKQAGADFIKMQKKDVESFYSEEKLNSEFASPYGKTYRDYRSIFEFDASDMRKFDAKCEEIGIKWFSTIQDITSLEWYLSNDFNMPMVKVASVNAKNKELIEAITKGFPNSDFVISTGGLELSEIEEVVDFLTSLTAQKIIVQQCTSTYPCPSDQLFLANITKLKKELEDKYSNVKIGYSGHEVGFIPSIIAASLGAYTIERHFCLSRHSFIHHIECSLEPDEFKEMVETINTLPYMLKSEFGLKKSEKKFLIDGTYGTDFLKSGSAITNNL
jgi:sialic acid synthase SpsE